ncbi:hypothetical protein ACG2LH_11120 [Zhouia sp. PK063]|uniref:hypothetical protein n=1 Tax=Zhouia sp. PK063 TaxID=3373602 RepID=UPI0037BB00EF
MMMNKRLTVITGIFILMNFLVCAQELENYKVSVFKNDSSYTHLEIINCTRKILATNTKNSFYIKGALGDKILITSPNFEDQFIAIGTEEEKNHEITLHFGNETINLDEVTVEHYDVNKLHVGALTSYTPKTYTPAERKLQTAGVEALKPLNMIGAVLSGNIPLDPIINTISGRMKRLKQNLIIENKIFIAQKLEDQFSSFLKTELKIGEENAGKFIYYVAELPDAKQKIYKETDENKIKNYLRSTYFEYLNTNIKP